MTWQVFGTIANPTNYVGLSEQGLIKFLNNLITLITVIAGIWTVFNLISAGLIYLNSNNEPQKLTIAGNKILQTVIGLAVIATAYTLAGILGYILFKNATILINPKLTQPQITP
jgi:hypothetical protein